MGLKIKNGLGLISRFMNYRNRKIEKAIRIFTSIFYIVVPPTVCYLLSLNQLSYMKGHNDSIIRLNEVLHDEIALAPLVLFIVFSILLCRSTYCVWLIIVRFINRYDRKIKRRARLHAIRQAKQIEAT
jgi:hypothetical protein